MHYSIISFTVNPDGTHADTTYVAKNIDTEEEAQRQLNEQRAKAVTEFGDKHYVTETGFWTFNILESLAPGGKAIKNFHIRDMYVNKNTY